MGVGWEVEFVVDEWREGWGGMLFLFLFLLLLGFAEGREAEEACVGSGAQGDDLAPWTCRVL